MPSTRRRLLRGIRVANNNLEEVTMRISSRSAKPLFVIGATLVIAACAGMTGQRPMGFLRQQHERGQRCRLWRLGGCRSALPAACRRQRRRRQDLARVLEHASQGWRAVGQRARPHRQRSLVQRQGELIATDAAALHSTAGNHITKQTALNEKGQVVNGRGDTPNRHDILTGSKPDGTAFSPNDRDMTCGNWTRSGPEGTAVVGHHDRAGPTSDPWSVSWNSSHESRGGCSIEALKGTGGDALLYCFASN
jgi:hypothetical protein